MASISNKIRCKLMNRLYNNQDIADIVAENCITERALEQIKEELAYITGREIVTESDVMTSEDILAQRNKFKKCSWQIIQKANQILIDKLYQLSRREKTIDDLIDKIEECLQMDNYDKTQMGKLIKLFESTKQNSISELARVIHILYDKQDEKNTPKTQEDDLESLLGNLVGDDF